MPCKQYDLTFIRPVINFSTLLSITPKCDFANSTIKHLKISKLIAAIFSVITTFCSFYFAYQRLKNIHLYKSKPIAYITEFRTVLITMSNVNAMMAIPFRNAGRFKQLIALTSEFANMPKCTQPKSYKKIYFLITVYNIYILTYTICDLIHSLEKSTFQDVQNYIYKHVQFYYFYMSSLLLFTFLFLIFRSLKAFNAILKDSIENAYKIDGSVFDSLYELTNNRARPQVKDFYMRELREVCKYFRVWCDVIKLFNKIFGWQIFITMMVIIFDLLLTLNMLIETTGPHLVLLLVWTITLIVLGMNLAHCCEKVKEELQTAFSVCYAGIYGGEGDVQESVRKELILLATQMAHRAPRISAAGFLLVDHNMLFTLMNMLISYIIVLQQIERNSISG